MNEKELAQLLKDNPDLRRANTHIEQFKRGMVEVAAFKQQFAESIRENPLPVNGNAATIITLPWPPSLNKLYRSTGSGIRITRDAIAYKNEVRTILRNKRVTLTTQPVSLTIHQYRPQKRGDIDNYSKLLLDSLQGYVYENDSQVNELHIFRHDDKRNPRVMLTIRTTP
jgi:crossover junction endodeoxyribonuclease RusA